MLHILLEDGNSALKNRVFPLPDGIRKHLQKTLDSYNGDKTVDGFKRLNNLLQMKNIEYNEMKRLKNYFDNYNGSANTIEYLLNGGDEMKLWVNNTLSTATNAIHDFKQTMKDAGVDNMFIKAHSKDRQTKTSKPSQSKAQTKNVSQNIKNNSSVRYESVSKQKRNIIITEEQADDIRKIIDP